MRISDIMKICFYTENYYKGGLDTFLINLYNAWPDKDDALTLVCNDSHPGLETISKKVFRPILLIRYKYFFTSSVSQKRTGLKGSLSYLIYGCFVLASRFLRYPFLFTWYIFKLSLFFRNSDLARLMVVNGGYPASLLCRCAIIAWRIAGKKSKAVMNFHNSTMESPWYFRAAENLIDHWVVRCSSRIISVSKNCLESLNTRRAFRACDNLSFVYNGIQDPAKAVKSIDVQTESYLSKYPYFLMLATYEVRKGHLYLLQAFQWVVKEFPQARLKIFGHGQTHEIKRVNDEVVRLGLSDNVELGGFNEKIDQL